MSNTPDLTLTDTSASARIALVLNQTATDKSWWWYPTSASTTGYTANDLNQYTAVGSVSPTYDGNGNLTYDGTYSYCYDADDRVGKRGQSILLTAPSEPTKVRVIAPQS
jgi:hypothetical protein